MKPHRLDGRVHLEAFEPTGEVLEVRVQVERVYVAIEATRGAG